MLKDNNKKIPESDEKNRICPSCRMSISILATKCRFCGEEVGRPKEAARHMTISDLGGETVHHRAPSGSVLDAMESFRMEEQQTQENEAEVLDDAEAVIGRRRQAEPTDISLEGGFDDLPTLDEGHSDIASLSLNRNPGSTRIKTKAPTPKQRIVGSLKIGIPVLIGLVILVKGFGWTREYVANQGEVDTPLYINRAPDILRTGGPPIKALAAAVDALEHERSNENVKIAEQSLQAVVQEVNKYLNASPWSLEDLNEASKIASAAVALYPNAVTNQLDAEVKEENAAYKMVLISVAPLEGTATFAMNAAGNKKSVIVSKGEVIGERFELRSILGRDKVKVEDKLRDNRQIFFDIGGLPHQ